MLISSNPPPVKYAATIAVPWGGGNSYDTSRSGVVSCLIGQKAAKPLSDVVLSRALHQAADTKDVTAHGLRSTFRDWVAEETDYPREVAEMALAHAIGDKVEAAYRRGDLFDKRREMMLLWNAGFKSR